MNSLYGIIPLRPNLAGFACMSNLCEHTESRRDGRAAVPACYKYSFKNLPVSPHGSLQSLMRVQCWGNGQMFARGPDPLSLASEA